MADGINVGSVEVDVVPNARDFNARLRSQLTSGTDAASRQISDALSRGIEDGISQANVSASMAAKGAQAGGSFSDAFQKRVKAALSALPSAEVKLDDEAAQAKLDFLREELTSLSGKKIGVDISDTDAVARLTALRAEMDNLAARSASVQVKVDTAAASAQLDRFFAETTVKARATGDEVGDDLTRHAASSVEHGSPLIMAAVAGGLIAGGPAVAAASVLLFGGISAIAASNVGVVQNAFKSLEANVLNSTLETAKQTSSEYVGMALDIQDSFDRLKPSITGALTGVAPEVHSIVDAFLDGAETAIPAFTRAIQQGQPVVRGLDTLITDIGTGVGGLLDEVTAHAPAVGQDLTDIGRVIGTALPLVGQLVGVGAELGEDILPPIDTGLRLVSGALNIVAPVLPVVVTGFLGFKAAQGVETILNGAGTGLLRIATALPDGALAGRIGGLGSALGGVAREAGETSALGSVMGPLSLGVGAVVAVMPALVHWLTETNNVIPKVTVDTQGLNAALAQSKGVINENVSGAAALALQQAGLFKAAQQWGVSTGVLTQAVLGNGSAMDQVKAAAERYKAAQDGAAQSTSNGSYQSGLAGDAYERAGLQSDEWLKAIQRLAGGTDSQVQKQKDLALAVSAASTSEQTNADRLQGIANTASAANTQISLLKGALDALTGANMTADQAQIAVTQAINVATQATQGQTGALVDANGQIDLNTAKGAAAASALINLAGTQHQEIATLEQQGANTDDVTAKSSAMRDQFIHTAEQMGFNAQQAQDLANRYLGIPGQVNTEVTADTTPAQSAIDNMLKGYGKVTYTGTSIVVGGRTIANADGNLLPMSATEATVVKPGAMRIIGDNPVADEAFIPINNSARSLSILGETAARMGLGLQPMANGGILTDYGTVRALAGQSLLDQVGAEASAAVAAAAPLMNVPASRAANEAAVQGVASGYGWGSGAQWSDLVAVIMRESGFNNVAQNPTSTAYGMFQFLNSTWGAYGVSKTSDPHLQAVAGLKYIASRYGSPAGALAHENAYGWYDQGGMIPPGPSLVYNGTGAPELIAPQQTFKQVMSGSSGGARGDVNGQVFNGPVTITDTDAMSAKGFRQAAMAAARFR
jgi:hypothetical protein